MNPVGRTRVGRAGTRQPPRFFDVASSDRSSKRPSRPANPRSRKKITPPSAGTVSAQGIESEPAQAPESETETGGRNVGSLEGMFSLVLGVLLVVAALFPRSIRQLLMLGIGGGLLYRGAAGRRAVYKALGVDDKAQ